MERLTKRIGCGLVCLVDGKHSCDIATEALKRLAAYEDTGLTPEEVELYKEAQEISESMEPGRLVELAQAERAGRLVVLPCKIGEMWDFEGGKTMEILGFHIDRWAGLSVLYSIADAGPDDDDSLSSCNLAYFLAHFTRQEAEEAVDHAEGD